MDRRTDQTDSQRWTVRQMNRQIDGQREVGKQSTDCRYIDRRSYKKTKRGTEGRQDMQKNGHSDREMDTLSDGQTIDG